MPATVQNDKVQNNCEKKIIRSLIGKHNHAFQLMEYNKATEKYPVFEVFQLNLNHKHSLNII